MAHIEDIITIMKNKSGLNQFEITILEDGGVRIDTGTFDPATHANAQNFINDIQRLLGGKITVVTRKAHRHHGHIHGHAHNH